VIFLERVTSKGLGYLVQETLEVRTQIDAHEAVPLSDVDDSVPKCLWGLLG
jgi:hypothetical protein